MVNKTLEEKIGKYVERLKELKDERYKTSRTLADYDSMLPGFAEARSRRAGSSFWFLDVGCGGGFASKELKQEARKRGGDAKTVGISLLDKRNGQTPARLSTTPMHELVRRGSKPKFDIITAARTLHYTPTMLETVEFLCNHCLRKGGEAFLHVPDETVMTMYGEQDNITVAEKSGERRFSWEAEIKRLKKQGLEIELRKGTQKQGPERIPVQILHFRNTGKKLAFPYQLKDFEMPSRGDIWHPEPDKLVYERKK